jgi:hypothetical protein
MYPQQSFWQPVFVIEHFFGSAVVNDRQFRALAAYPHKPRRNSLPVASPADALQAFAYGAINDLSHRLAGQPSKPLRPPVGRRILDIQTHAILPRVENQNNSTLHPRSLCEQLNAPQGFIPT